MTHSRQAAISHFRLRFALLLLQALLYSVDVAAQGYLYTFVGGEANVAWEAKSYSSLGWDIVGYDSTDSLYIADWDVNFVLKLNASGWLRHYAGIRAGPYVVEPLRNGSNVANIPLPNQDQYNNAPFYLTENSTSSTMHMYYKDVLWRIQSDGRMYQLGLFPAATVAGSGSGTLQPCAALSVSYNPNDLLFYYPCPIQRRIWRMAGNGLASLFATSGYLPSSPSHIVVGAGTMWLMDAEVSGYYGMRTITNSVVSDVTIPNDGIFSACYHKGRSRLYVSVSAGMDSYLYDYENLTAGLGSTAGGGWSLQDGVRGNSASLGWARQLACRTGDDSILWRDGFTSSLRRLNGSGWVDTALGNAGRASFAGDGASGVAARVQPTYLAAAANDQLFVYDRKINRVRRMLANGTLITAIGGGTGRGDGGPATSAIIDTPFSLALSAADGALYIACVSDIRKVTTAGVITTVAGGTKGVSGRDGIPATAAYITAMYGLLVHTDGSVLFVDSSQAKVRRIWSNGTITTFFGSGSAGCWVPGQVPLKTAMSQPAGIAFRASDSSFFISDAGCGLVYRITPSQVVSIFAGSLSPTDFTGNNVLATTFLLPNPTYLAYNTKDTSLYIANSGAIWRVASNNYIYRYAGSDAYIPMSDGQPATSVSIVVRSLAIHPGDGTIYFGDDVGVRRILQDGTISTVAGGSFPPDKDNGDGGLAAAAVVYSVFGMTITSTGTVFLSTPGRVRRISTSNIMTTYAGGSGLGDGRAATQCFVVGPAVASPRDGTIYTLSDMIFPSWTKTQAIRKVWPNNTITTLTQLTGASSLTVAMDGTLYFVNVANGQTTCMISSITLQGDVRDVMACPTSAQQYWIRSGNKDTLLLTLDSNVYIIDTNTQAASIVASSGSTGDEGPATSARLGRWLEAFQHPLDGSIVVADYEFNIIRRIASGIITTVAGSKYGLQNAVGGSRTVNLGTLHSIAVHPVDGTIYVADSGSIRRVIGIDIWNITANASAVTFYVTSTLATCLFNNQSAVPFITQFLAAGFQIGWGNSALPGQILEPCLGAVVQTALACRSGCCYLARFACPVPKPNGGMAWHPVVQAPFPYPYNATPNAYTPISSLLDAPLQLLNASLSVDIVAGIGRLTICGINMGFRYWSAILPGVRLTRNSSMLSLGNSGSCLISNWSLESDIRPWLYLPTTIQVVTLNNRDNITISPLPLPLSVNTSVLQLGTCILVTAPYLGLVNVTGVTISHGPPLGPGFTIPCFSLRREGAHSLSCCVKVVYNTKWPKQANFSISFYLSTNDTALLGTVVSANLSLSVATGEFTANATSETAANVTFNLPGDLLTSTDVTYATSLNVAMEAPSRLRAFFSNASIPSSACSALPLRRVTCAVPTAALSRGFATLEIAGLTNLTADIFVSTPSYVPSNPGLTWGSVLRIVSSNINRVASVRLLYNVSMDRFLPCINLFAPNANEVRCTLRYINSYWEISPAIIAVQYSGSQSWLVLSASFMIQRPAATVAATFIMQASSIGFLALDLPQPLFSTAELSSSRLDLGWRTSIILRNTANDTVWCTPQSDFRINCLFPATPEASGTYTLEVFGNFSIHVNSTVIGPLLTAPQVARWGDRIRITGRRMEALGAIQAVNFSNGASPSLPCLLDPPSLQVVDCTMRYMRSSWAFANLSMDIIFSASAEPVRLPPGVTNLILMPPQLSGALVSSSTGWIPREGGCRVNFTIPVPIWSVSEVLLVGGALTGGQPQVRVWIDDQTCAAVLIINTTLVSCVAPAGLSSFARATLELAGQLNISLPTATGPYTAPVAPTLSYGPPVPIALAPNRIHLPNISVIPQRNISFSIQYSEDIRELFVGFSRLGVMGYICNLVLPRPSAPGAVTSVVCTDFDVAGLVGTLEVALDVAPAGAFPQLEVALDIEYTWVYMQKQIMPIQLVFVTRPIVSHVLPTSVTVGSPLLVFGDYHCPDSPDAVNVTVLVHGQPCLVLYGRAPDLVSCAVPAVSLPKGVNVASVHIVNCLGVTSVEDVRVTFPAPATISLLTPLTTECFPSDPVNKWPCPHPINLSIAELSNETVTDAVCSITSDEPLVSVLPLDVSLIRNVPVPTGNWYVGRIYIQGTYDVSTFRLIISCTRASGSGTVTPLEIPLAFVPTSTRWCMLPSQNATSQVLMAPWSIAIQRVEDSAFDTTEYCEGAASHLMLADGVGVPSIACTVYAIGAPDIVIQGGSIARPAGGQISKLIYTGFAISGGLDSVITLNVSCTLAGVLVPNILSTTVTMLPCDPGTQPINGICAPCGKVEYSLGGNSTCVSCPPVGATCLGGVITLSTGFYRPPSQEGQQINSETELHPCFNEAACTLEASKFQYGCASGYSGPLCGVCDAAANYASSGNSCVPCWDPDKARLFMAFFVMVILAALAFVATRPQRTGKKESSIALRILLTFAQAVGSLRAFRASGTRTYYNLTGFTSSVSSSPLSWTPLQCVTRQDYLGQFAFTFSAPVLAGGGVLVIFLLITTFHATRLKPKASFDKSEFMMRIKAWTAERRHISSLLFVAQLAYTPIVSAALKALDCEGPIDKRMYLREDLSVECTHNGRYATLFALAVAAVVLVGAGFPMSLFIVLFRASKETLESERFRKTWGLLYDGYRQPDATARRKLRRRGFAWWEATVLVRKAAIVLLAVLVREELPQIVGAVLLAFVFLQLQLKLSPYTRSLFNRMEAVSLFCTFLTAILSALLIAVQPTAPTGATYTSNTALSGLPSSEAAITLILLMLNIGCLVSFFCIYCYLLYVEVRTSAMKKPLSLPTLRNRTKIGQTDATVPAVPTLVRNPLRVHSVDNSIEPKAAPVHVTAGMDTGRANAAPSSAALSEGGRKSVFLPTRPSSRTTQQIADGPLQP